MTALPLVFWRTFVLVLPVMTVAIAYGISVLVVDLYLETPRSWGQINTWSVVSVFALFTAVFVALAPVRIPLIFEPIYLLAVPLGMSMYELDRLVGRYLYGPLEKRAFTRSWIFLFGVVTPLTEEIVYRLGVAVVFGDLGVPWYVLLSAGLFGLHHLQLGRLEVLRKSGNGAVYAATFVVTGSVVAPMLAHVGYNAFYLIRNH